MPIFKTDRGNRYGVSYDAPACDGDEATVMVGCDSNGDRPRRQFGMTAFSIDEAQAFAAVIIIEAAFASGWKAPEKADGVDRSLRGLLVKLAVDRGCDRDVAARTIDALVVRRGS